MEKQTFSDIFRTDGAFDLYKLQMFLFTVGTALYVVARIAFYQVFPVLDANLLLLLGISNGIYVGSKVATGSSPFRLAEQLDAEVALLNEALVTRSRALDEINAKEAKLQTGTDASNSTVDAEAELRILKSEKLQAEQKVKELREQLAAKSAARAEAIKKL